MKRPTSAAVLARIATVPVPAPAAPGAPASTEGAVDALRRRLASSSAREHVVLDFLDDDLHETRATLAAVAAWVANVEDALADGEPSAQRLMSLAAGRGVAERIEYLQTVMASVRRRLAQVAARM